MNGNQPTSDTACVKCGCQFPRVRRVGRPSLYCHNCRGSGYRSSEWSYRKQQLSARTVARRCQTCGSAFAVSALRRQAKYCQVCKPAALRAAGIRAHIVTPTRIKRCEVCGGEMPYKFHRKRCQMCETDRIHRRRVAASSASVPRRYIFARDGGVCGICKRPIDQAVRWPHPGSFTLDHIVPLHAGGLHVASNLQAAHLGCNARKRDKLGVQPLLIG